MVTINSTYAYREIRHFYLNLHSPRLTISWHRHFLFYMIQPSYLEIWSLNLFHADSSHNSSYLWEEQGDFPPKLHTIIKEYKGYRLEHFLIRYNIQYDLLFNKFYFTMCSYEDRHKLCQLVCAFYFFSLRRKGDFTKQLKKMFYQFYSN